MKAIFPFLAALGIAALISSCGSSQSVWLLGDGPVHDSGTFLRPAARRMHELLMSAHWHLPRTRHLHGRERRLRPGGSIRYLRRL